MVNISRYSCPNQKCRDFGLRALGNISVRGRYGKNNSRTLLYCRTCSRRFAASRASAMFGIHLPPDIIRGIIAHTANGKGIRGTARLMELDKDTVNRVVLRAGEQCARTLSELLASLELDGDQIDILCAFVKTRKLLPVQFGNEPADRPERQRGGNDAPTE